MSAALSNRQPRTTLQRTLFNEMWCKAATALVRRLTIIHAFITSYFYVDLSLTDLTSFSLSGQDLSEGSGGSTPQDRWLTPTESCNNRLGVMNNPTMAQVRCYTFVAFCWNFALTSFFTVSCLLLIHVALPGPWLVFVQKIYFVWWKYTKSTVTRASPLTQICTKSFVVCDFAPDPTGELTVLRPGGDFICWKLTCTRWKIT